MRIVVISEGESLDSEVGEDFGHSPFFLVVDSDTLDYHVIENEFADSPEGAGVAVAKAITTIQPDAVITGGIGMHGLDIILSHSLWLMSIFWAKRFASLSIGESVE